MSLYKTRIKNKQIADAILDEVAYFAIFGIKPNAEEVFKFLKIKTSFVATKQQLNKLVAGKKISTSEGRYYIPGYKYSKLDIAQQTKLLNRAKLLALFIGQLPWIKSIVVSGSVAYGNCNSESDIDLTFITSEKRLYIAKGIVYYLLRAFNLKETPSNKAGKFSTGWWLTTRGFRVEKDFGSNFELNMPYRLLLAKPVYGQKTWQQILYSNDFIRKRFPNYNFVCTKSTIKTTQLSMLDRLDSLGYRMHLKHVSRQAKYNLPNTLLRIRPDIAVQCQANQAKIISRYVQIRSSLNLRSKKVNSIS